MIIITCKKNEKHNISVAINCFLFFSLFLPVILPSFLSVSVEKISKILYYFIYAVF